MNQLRQKGHSYQQVANILNEEATFPKREEVHFQERRKATWESKSLSCSLHGSIASKSSLRTRSGPASPTSLRFLQGGYPLGERGGLHGSRELMAGKFDATIGERAVRSRKPHSPIRTGL